MKSVFVGPLTRSTQKSLFVLALLRMVARNVSRSQRIHLSKSWIIYIWLGETKIPKISVWGCVYDRKWQHNLAARTSVKFLNVSPVCSGLTISLLPPVLRGMSGSCRLSASVATASVSYLGVRETQTAAYTHSKSWLKLTIKTLHRFLLF